MRNRNFPSAGLVIPRRTFVAGAVAAGAASALGPLAASAQDQPRRGGTLRVAAPAATGIDPLKLNTPGAIAIVQQVAEYLVWVEPDLTLRPVLATAWEASDGNRTWTFQLRRGVRFHDGREMTAADVVATFRRLVAPSSESPARSALPFLDPEGVAEAGPHTVVFRLDRPVGDFPYFTQTYQAVVLPADYAGNFAERPIGTGPFRLVGWQPQVGARFERFADYWDAPRPHLDGVEIRVHDGASPMLLALRAGEADVVQQVSTLDARVVAGDPAIRLLEAEAGDHRQITMRTDQPPFDDVRVRRAVALCLDRQALVQGMLGGRGRLGNDHPIAPIYPVRLSVPQRTADVAEARRLLAAAGHGNGFEAELSTHQLLELPQLAAAVQQMLAPAGIRVRLRVEPSNLFYARWPDIPFCITEWTTRASPSQILAQSLRGDAPWNVAKWRNERFDRTLDAFEGAADPAERSRLADEMATILNQEVPAVIPYFVKTLRAVRVPVRGVEANMSNFLDLSRAWIAT